MSDSVGVTNVTDQDLAAVAAHLSQNGGAIEVTMPGNKVCELRARDMTVTKSRAPSKHQIRTPEEALAYLVDCTIATVESMAMLKSRKKSEYERQISIAQTGVDWMTSMKISPAGTRAEEIIALQLSVADWATKYEP